MNNVSLLSLLFIFLLISCETETYEPDTLSTPGDAISIVENQPYVSEDNKLPSGTDWVQIWGDEFSGNQIDLSKWNITVSNKSRNPRWDKGIHDWRWDADHAFLNNRGQLILRGSKTGANTMRCGSVDSRGKFEPRYGYMEARIQIAKTWKANHTAFWLQGYDQGNVDGTANDGAEIDIFESAWNGAFTKSVIHIDGYGKDHKANTKRYETPGIHNGYHVYGLDWGPNHMDIYYDGVKKVSYSGNWVPNVKEWLWLSVGASFGDGDFSSQPIGTLSDARVDYVRVWKKGVFRLINKQTGKWFRTNGSDNDSAIQQSPRNLLGGWTTWSIKKSSGSYFYIVNTGTGKYIRPVSNTDRSGLVLKDSSYGGAWTQWYTVDAGDGYFYIVNRETGKHLAPQNAADNAPIIIRPRNIRNDWFKWKFEFLE